MKRILVPLDGSEFAERALAPAMALARRDGSELHLVSIVSDLPPVPLASGEEDLVSGWFEEEEERARHYLAKVSDRLSQGAKGVTIVLHVELGPVTRTLEAMCENLDVDLIMLTTHGRGAWQRAWLGSVADQLLRSSDRPLLLLRSPEGDVSLFEAAGTPTHTLVPLDGSDAAEAVLAALPAVLPERGGRVTLASVVHRPFPLATTYLPHTVTDQNATAERKGALESYLQDLAGELRRDGLIVDTEVLVEDDAAQGLLEFAEERDVDLIALSTRGRGGVTRFFLGSVADKLVRGAKVPILTTRRPSEDEQAADEA